MNLLIATTTRADWGLLSPLARELSDRGVGLTIAASASHLDTGSVSEIRDDGFDPLVVEAQGDDKAVVMSKIGLGFSRLLNKLRPDAMVLLGDRYEMLPVAAAAMVAGVPVIHIAGGTVSLGAYDDSIRHAITKLSTLHLVETDECARRVVQMGETPERVVTTGAIGVYNSLNVKRLNREQLISSLGFNPGDRFLLATLHAATLSSLSPAQQLQNLLDALDGLPDVPVLFTHPNNDADHDKLVGMLDSFAMRRENVHVVPSLGRVRYLSAAALSAGVIGNSSSGIVEIPSLKVPVLDIGERQLGRQRSDAVLHCDADTRSIIAGLREILSEEARRKAQSIPNPYMRPYTPRLMADAITGFPFKPFQPKPFHEL